MDTERADWTFAIAGPTPSTRVKPDWLSAPSVLMWLCSLVRDQMFVEAQHWRALFFSHYNNIIKLKCRALFNWIHSDPRTFKQIIGLPASRHLHALVAKHVQPASTLLTWKHNLSRGVASSTLHVWANARCSGSAHTRRAHVLSRQLETRTPTSNSESQVLEIYIFNKSSKSKG